MWNKLDLFYHIFIFLNKKTTLNNITIYFFYFTNSYNRNFLNKIRKTFQKFEVNNLENTRDDF